LVDRGILWKVVPPAQSVPSIFGCAKAFQNARKRAKVVKGNRQFKHPIERVCQPRIPAATAAGLAGLAGFPPHRPTSRQISPIPLAIGIGSSIILPAIELFDVQIPVLRETDFGYIPAFYGGYDGTSPPQLLPVLRED
jgi:hypothetical protein